MDLITMVLACSLYNDNSITNAIAEVGSKSNPLTVTSVGGERKVFKTQNEAATYALSELQQGHEIEIGLMQIPSRWLKDNNIALNELFGPCKNLVTATQILNSAAEQCNEVQSNASAENLKSCTLSIYKTGDPQAGLDYAHTIMDYANSHSFDDIIAAAKKKNPKEFEMVPHPPPPKFIPPKKIKITPEPETNTESSPSNKTDDNTDEQQ